MPDSLTKPSALFDPSEFGNGGPNDPQSGSISVPSSEQPKPIKDAVLLSILKRQKFHCPYSGRKLTPQTAGIVYHVPLARGGRHEADNLRIVHRDLVPAKGGMMFEELVALCRDVIEAKGGG